MEDLLCLFAMIGFNVIGHKELLALFDGCRESSASWEEVLMDLRQRELKPTPILAVGDRALEFWKAVAKL